MKVQNVFSTGLNYPQKNSSFGAKIVSKPGDDFSGLIDYASQDDKTTKELMVALKMLDHKIVMQCLVIVSLETVKFI